MKYFDTFTGIGGFTKAIQDVIPQAECVGYSEIDKYAIQTYEKHYPNHKNYGDITAIDVSKLPDFDLLVGGFPCQSFSIAGLRGGFSDTRGTLFFEITRILKNKRPTYLLLENVKGLLSHDNGRTFQTIMWTLDGLGYDTQWQVLNSKNFGVPQNRERVFIIGHLRGTTRPEVFPFTGSAGSDYEQVTSTAIDANYWKGIDNHGQRTAIIEDFYPDRVRVFDESPTLRSDRSGLKVGTLRTHKDGNGFREMKSGLAPTIPARAREDGSGQPVLAIPVLTPDRVEKRQNGRRFKEDGDPAFTLTAQDRHGIYDGIKIRRLTPVECERLQGFPDNWTNVTESSIMEICVSINPAIEKLLPVLDIVSCTTNAGKDMVRQISSSKKDLPATFAIDGLLPENFAIDITKAGKDTVIRFKQKEMLHKDMKTQLNHIGEKTDEKFIYRLWSIILEENLSKEKLSTTLTSINEIMTSPIFTSVNQEQNITGYIIRYSSQLPSYSKRVKYPLTVTNTKSLMSDTQRYKQLGNAVTVNVVEELVKRLSS